jgi:hypothetical protein
MLLSKGKILLKVHFAGSEVRITPVIGEFDNKELLSLYARNEELLTQFHFITSDTKDTHIHLGEYFMQRGWHVEPGLL